MRLYKILFHICAFFKMLFLKIVYGKKLCLGKRITWRRRFNVMISENATITIGDDCFFNNDCSINALSKITIGNGCIFGENVKIYDHNHEFKDVDIPLKKQGYSVGDVFIGNNCWIGSNVLILKGAVIGDNSVIAAGTIIDSNIEKETVVKLKKKYILEKIRRKDCGVDISNNGSV